jgi:hypothetical protein
MNQSSNEMFTPFIQYIIENQDLTMPTKTAQPQQRENDKSNGRPEERRVQNLLEMA